MATNEVRPIGRDGTIVQLARWSAGVPVASLRYLVQRVPLYRRSTEDRSPEDDDLPDLARDLPGDPDRLQRADDGVGQLFHRIYRIAVTDEELDAEELLAQVVENPTRLAPTRLSRFETFDGRIARDLQVGDELVVRLPGPWDGPVRVIGRGPTALRLATLRGHMEAGEIEFTTGYDDRGFLRFQIESWARSGDRLFDVLYERLPVGREMQLHLWSQFCQQVAKLSGGVRMTNVVVITRRIT